MQGLTPYNLKIISEVLGGMSYPLELLSLLEDKALVVDLGANIGSFSLACNALRPDIRLLAVEPDPNNFIALKANLSSLNAELHQIALTEHDGETQLFLGMQDTVANSVFSGEMVSGQRSVTVQSRDTKSFLEEIAGLNGKIGLLKSDTEGGEWHLLRLQPQFIAAIPMIFLEYHSASFLEQFLGAVLHSHVIYSGTVRFPHRGEIALLRKDLVPHEQSRFEILPAGL